MWFRLSRDQLGYRFRRQYGVGRYILDFYCPELRLAVEVDGDSHAEPESVEYDTCRDEYCASVGILTLRFTNLEVQESLESVVEQVRETCHLRAQSSSSARS